MNSSKITVFENGPFKIDNASKIESHSGKEIDTNNTLILCRCGDSNTKPYCDGTHIKNGFNGEADHDFIENITKEYVGMNITIFDNRNICAHRGYCKKDLPTVFKDESPWIDPDGDSIDNIIALCNKCPSGALTYALTGQSKAIDEYNENVKIRLSEKHFGCHGPYDITGEFVITGQTNREPELPNRATLCRCGASKNKPYCSGEHYNIRFIDDQDYE